MLLHHLKLKKVLYYFIAIGFYQIQTMQEIVQCDEQQEINQEVLPLSLSLSYFKQRDINLPLKGNDIIPLTFDQPQGMFVSNYKLDGKLIGRLITTDSVMRFEACGKQLHDFSLTTPLQADLFEVSSGGKFIFQKPIKFTTAFLGCKSVTFLDKFLSEQNLFIDTDCCDIYGDLSCLNFLCKSKFFNVMSEGSLAVQDMAHFPCLESLFNDGKISIGKDAVIQTLLLENYGDLRIGSLDATGNNIANMGTVDITDSFVVVSDSINNQGNWKVGQDCFFKQVGQLSTSQKSQWHVGKDWKAHVDKIFLEGRSLVGNLTLFDVGSSAILSGPFRSHIFHLDSKGLIRCTPQSEFFVNHHLGFKARGWIEYAGDTLEKALSKNKQQSSLQETDHLFELFPQGVFLHSMQSGIKKSGTIVARNGSVSLLANKFVTVSGLTESGFNPHAMLAMNAAFLICKKDSVLQAFNAHFTAQDFIEQHGKALINQQLIMDATKKIINTGPLNVGTTLAIKSNDILAEKSSTMHAANIVFEAEEIVDQKGSIDSKNFLTQSSAINLHDSSKVTSDTIQLQAQDKIDQKGTIDSENIIARTKAMTNSGAINSQNMKMNIDRWLWNTGNVTIQEALTMDALAACNIFGMMRAKKFTGRVGLDVNFLGLYQAQSSDVNALIGIQAGLSLPAMSSSHDIFTQNNIMGLSENLAMNVIPHWAKLTWKGGKTLYKLPSMYEKTSHIYRQSQLLYGQKDAGVSDWIPLLCDAKDITLSSMQVARIGTETYNAIPIAIQDFQNFIEDFVNDPNESGLEIWKKTSNFIDTFDFSSRETLLRMNHGANLIASYGPFRNRSTLLDLNIGINLGVNGQSTSLWSMHSGVSAFVNNYTDDSLYGKNFGFAGANNLNMSATHNYSNFGPLAYLCGVSGNVAAGDLDIYGNIYMVDRAAMQARKKARIGASIDAGSASVQATESVDLVTGGKIDAKNGPVNVAAKKVTSDVDITSQENINMQGADIALRKSSDLTSKVGSVNLIGVDSVDLVTGGKIDAQQGKVNVVAKKITSDVDIDAHDCINMQGTDIIALSRNSYLTSKAGVVNLAGTEEISIAGHIDSQEFLTRAKFIKSSGDINSEFGHIKGDRYWWNMGGTVNIKKNLTIDALVCINSMNSENALNKNSWSWDLNSWNPWSTKNSSEYGKTKFGFVKAPDLTIRAGVNINYLSCYQSQEGYINSFIDINAGLYLPQFDSWNDLCTERNAWMAGDYVASWFIPQFAMKTGKYGCNAVKMYQSNKLGNLCRNIQQLREMENSEVCDWIPSLLEVKDVGMFAKQGYDIGVEGYKAIPSEADRQKHIDNFVDNLESFRNNPEQLDFLKQTIYKFVVEQFKAPQATEASQNNLEELNFFQQKIADLQQAASNYIDTLDPSVRQGFGYANRGINLAGTLYGSNLNKNSLLDFDAGINLGINGNSTSIWSMHSGISAFTGNYTIDTCYGKNFGPLVAGNLNILATHDYSSSGPLAGLYGITGSATAENLDIYGRAYMFDRLSLHARNHARIKADVATWMNNTSIKAHSLNNSGATIRGGLGLDVATQPVHIGTVDAQGKAFQYQGPVGDGFADELVDGSGEHMQLSNASSVVLVAGKQDVHFKEGHTVPHTVQVVTDGSITADKSILSEKSILLDAKGDVLHNSLKAAENIGIVGDNVTAQSTVKRVGDGNNYEDLLHQVSMEAGAAIDVHAGRDVNHAAIHTKSGAQGTHITANRNVNDKAVQLESYIEDHTKGHIKKDEIQTDTQTPYINNAVSHHESLGDYNAHAGEKYIGEAPQFATKGASAKGEKGTEFRQVYNTTSSLSDCTESGGWLFKHSKTNHTESPSISSFGAHFDTQEKPVISAPQGAVILEGISGTAPIVQSRDPVTVKLNQTISQLSSYEIGSNIVFDLTNTIEQFDHDYHPLQMNGKMEIDAPAVNIQVVKGQVLDVLEQMSMHGDGAINQMIVENIHLKDCQSTTTLTSQASIVLALAITAASAGVASAAGASLVAAVGINSAIAVTVVESMTASAITTFNIQVAQALLECQGDFNLAVKKIASTETLKQVAISAATAGCTAGLHQGFDKLGLPDVKKADNFLQRIAYVAPRQAARAALLTSIAAFSGQDLQTAALQNARQALAGTISTACASQIGHDYGQGNIDPITHKLLHGMTGALAGGVVGGKEGAFAGGMGALVAETVADVFAPTKPDLAMIYDLEAQKGSPLTLQEFTFHWNSQSQEYLNSVLRVGASAKMTAAVAAFLARQDADIASFTATTAVDNNFFVLAAAGLTAASVAYSAYNVINAYEKGGWTGCAQQLGIEVVCYGAGYAAGEIVSQVAFKVGGAMYPTVEAAVNAALDQVPGVKMALGSCVNKMIIAGEKYSATTFAKWVAHVEGGILQVEASVVNGAAQVKDKALKQIGLSGHAQPGSLLIPEIGLGSNSDMCAAARFSKDPIVREILGQKVDDGVNLTCQAILKDGYYEVNGMKFSEYYYNRLWNNGRPAPTFIVKDILQSADIVIPHIKTVGKHTKLPGFLQYQTTNWELVYNPITKEVWHLEPLKVIKLK